MVNSWDSAAAIYLWCALGKPTTLCNSLQTTQGALFRDPTLKVKDLIRLRMQLVSDNEDLLTEILLRLPAKSLTRFKSVCKKWLSIISSDEFCHQHTLRLPKLQPSLMLRLNYKEFFYFNPTTNGEKKMIPYDKSELVPGCTIAQACNGLMLLQLRDPDDSYFVYNPTTRRLRKIVLTHNEKYPRVFGINLAFDPSKSPYYKIVCTRSIVGTSCMFTYQIEVYDSESHTWKIGLEAFTSGTHLSSEGILWNNGIYWRALGGFCWFDIGTNEMKTLCYPYNSATDCAPRLQESNGHLYCYVVDSETIVVWELRRNDDHRLQWLVKDHDFIGECDTANAIVRFMGRSDGDGDELLYHADGKIWTYNFGYQTYNKNPLDFKTQPCDQPGENGYFYVKAFHFGETLALV